MVFISTFTRTRAPSLLTFTCAAQIGAAVLDVVTGREARSE